MPIGRDLHLDTPLTNFAVQAFQSQQDYIAPTLLPIINVGKQSDKYYVLDRDSWLATPLTAKRAPKTAPRRVEWKTSSDAYFADNYALAGEISKEDLSNADMALMLRERTSEFVTEMLVRDYEQRVATLFTTAANFAAGHVTSLSGAAQWTAISSADIRAQVTSAHAAIRNDTGVRANTLIVDFDSYQLMSQNSRLLNNFAYTEVPGMLTDQQLRTVLQVDRIVVGKAIRNSATEKTSSTSAWASTNVWGRNAILCHLAPATTLKAMTFAAGFRWTPAGVPSAFQAYRYDDPDPGKKVEVVEVGFYQDEKAVAPNLGYLIGSTG